MILLDEPSEGLAPMVVRNLIEVINEIGERGMTILLADQNVKFCREVCERGYIIERGCIMHEGTMEAIWEDEEVIKKYLVL
jgi:branched-chain amino acid transport system ATP-binding protein